MYQIVIHKQDADNLKLDIFQDQILVEEYEENIQNKRLEGNFYLGKVTSVLSGMQAAFVDIGEGKNAFIHMRDLLPKVSNVTGNSKENMNNYSIKDFVKQNDSVFVQIKKDQTAQKGARISTDLQLTGRYIVFMPYASFVTVSQKIEDTKEQQRLKSIVEKAIPESTGAIIRTSAIGKDEEELEDEISKLLERWNEIDKKKRELEKSKAFPCLVWENQGIIEKSILDFLDKGLEEILVDDRQVEEELKSKYKDIKTLKIEYRKDLKNIYDLEKQQEKKKDRKIWLKCGGFITIDQTEALTAIDVNSGKYIGKDKLEDTVHIVNKEATVEIAKQLRLKDIGGIIIIDYIDMHEESTRNDILELLKNELKNDRSKTQVLGFTKLDLLEMTRKHIHGRR